jgi:hypothetical protein
MKLKVVAGVLLAIGILLGGQFLWSLPDLAREVQEGAQGNHLPLALMGALVPEERTVSGILIGGVGALVLTAAGAVLLHRSRSH